VYLSEKKRSEVYEAIAGPITQQRIELQNYGSPNSELLDSKLFKMQNEIWRRVHKALNIEGPT